MLKRLWFHRSDGKQIKHKDPILRLIPYVMPKRYDAQVFFSETCDVTHTDQWIKQQRKNADMKLMLLHVMIAAGIRTIAEYPKLNRFVSGSKVYARNHIAIAFAIKKEMTIDAPETVIKVLFDTQDTLIDVMHKTNAAIAHNQALDQSNKTDRFARLLNLLPGWLLSTAFFMIRRADAHRLLPRKLIDLSPFHSSTFITDLGSLGVEPVYHHIYDLGTTSMFLAFGLKRKSHGTEGRTKHLNIKLVIDERITDGFYFAQAFKRFMRLVKEPETLIEPPKKLGIDHEIRA